MNENPAISWPSSTDSELSRLILEPQCQFWKGTRGDWVVIPTGDELTRWFVVAAGSEGVRRSREVIRAFVGPSVGRLSSGSKAAIFKFGDHEQSQAQVLELTTELPENLLSALHRLVVVRSSKPSVTRNGASVLAHLLRDFRLAIFDNDGAAAQILLNRLRNDGRLSGENLDFLQIELLGRFGRWRELRDLPWFPQLARAPRPHLITELMIQSIWWVDFVGAEADAPSKALAQFRTLPADLHRLYDAIDVPMSSPGIRIAALRSFDQGSAGRLERVRAVTEPSVRQWIDSVVARVDDPTEHLSIEERARKMFSDGRYVDLVALAVDRPDDVIVLEIAVRAVAEIDSPDLATRLNPLLTLRQQQRLPKTPGFMRCLDQARALVVDNCESWAGWFERVARVDPWPSAAEVLRRDSSRWSYDDLVSGPTAEGAIRNLESAIEGVNGEAIQQVMDLLCELAASLVPNASATAIVDAIIYALLDSQLTEPLGSAILGLIQSALRSNPTRRRYNELIDVCVNSDQLLNARVLIPVVLDLLDEFAMYPSPDLSERSKLGRASLGAFQAHAKRGNLTSDEIALVELLLDELGLPNVRLWVQTKPGNTEASELDPWIQLAGRTVALYTLLEGIGTRFESRLHHFCPTAKVVVLSDHASTERLRSNAHGADYFIVDTRHAKHAATIEIDRIRPKNRQLLPEGKGISSFIRCLGDALRIQQ